MIILVLIFRRLLAKLLPALSRLKWKDLELEFKRELAEIGAAAQQAKLPPPSEVAKPTPSPAAHQFPEAPRTLEEEINAVAEVSPRAAVPLAWAAVETELLRVVMRLAVSSDFPPSSSAVQNIRHLQHAGTIDEATVEVLQRMRRLRNRTVHGDLEETAITLDDALEYSQLAQSVIANCVN